MLSMVKLLLKGEVRDCVLNSPRNYIVDHGKSWKNHGIVFLNFCGNRVLYFGVARCYLFFSAFLDLSGINAIRALFKQLIFFNAETDVPLTSLKCRVGVAK